MLVNLGDAGRWMIQAASIAGMLAPSTVFKETMRTSVIGHTLTANTYCRILVIEGLF